MAYQGDAERYVCRDNADAAKSRLRLPRMKPTAPDMPERGHNRHGDAWQDEFPSLTITPSELSSMRGHAMLTEHIAS